LTAERIEVVKLESKIVLGRKCILRNIITAAAMVSSVSAYANDLSNSGSYQYRSEVMPVHDAHLVEKKLGTPSKVVYQENKSGSPVGSTQFRMPVISTVVVKDFSDPKDQTRNDNPLLLELETWGMLLVSFGVITLRVRGMIDRSKRVFI
jgi:hypothetical protein